METGTVPAVGGDSSEGGGAPNDDLGNVAQGDGTYLNTREWKYAAFFNRVKHAITARWDPNGRLRGRSVGFADRVTVVGVTLRPDGSLADAYVAKSSGVDVLDHEAIAAFERAQPFLNPPPQLVEAGDIRFTFGFTLSTETSLGSPNFFRVGR